MASILDVDLNEVLVGSVALYLEPDLKVHERALEASGPGKLAPAYSRYVSALALASARELGVVDEVPDRVEEVLERDSWTSERSWIFGFEEEYGGDETLADVIRAVREGIHHWDKDLSKSRSDVGAESASAVIPSGTVMSVRLRFLLGPYPEFGVGYPVDVIVGSRSRHPAPILREATPERLVTEVEKRLGRSPYAAVRVCPERTLGTTERAAVTLPGVIALASSLVGARVGLEWLVELPWFQDRVTVSVHWQWFRTRGPFVHAFPLDRAINAQIGLFRRWYWFYPLAIFLGHQDKVSVPKLPIHGFPHRIVRQYGDVTGTDPWDTPRWEEDGEHRHGPAASLATAPDLELKRKDVESLEEGLERLRNLLSGLGEVDALIDAAIDLIR